ncbi:MAG: NADH-quinone oxidoreductase subunit F [Actinomycetia bacterium]|nr:NADH-quinone oxidoreductase subunit F [Actinomycetes bacterium]
MNYEQVRTKAESALRRAQAPAAAGPAPRVYPLERRVALRNCGRIDPGSIDEYIARCAGYSGFAHALGLGREGVVAGLLKTGLRGRGGAGYSTALKWLSCRDAQGDVKYAVCNAVDADPRARTARLLLGGDPHSVLEGLLIGAYATGANHCFVCTNAAYREEIATMSEAVLQMRERGLLGDDILESGFSCDITVREIASSPVAGEETALIQALENRQPLPYLRLDYPAVRGLHGKPTLVNSAETLANVSAIFQQPSGQRPGSVDGDNTDGRVEMGTKVVTVCGDVARPATVEVLLGTTIGALLEATQGPSFSRLDIKAVQFGGPTGAFFAGASLDTAIAYEDIAAAGSVMGSGTLRVIGDGGSVCAVEMARETMFLLRDQSCGKCAACREGTYQLAGMLDDIAGFRAKPGDLELMMELCAAMKTGSICGLGRTAPLPLLSSLKLFADDFSAHIDAGRCPVKG